MKVIVVLLLFIFSINSCKRSLNEKNYNEIDDTIEALKSDVNTKKTHSEEKAIDILALIGHNGPDSLKMKCFSVLFTICYYKDSLPCCITYSDSLLLYGRKSNEQKSLSGILGNKGIILKRLGNFSESIKCFERSLEIKDSMKIDNSSTLVNLSNLYFQQRQYQNAIKINRKLIGGNKNLQFHITNSLAMCYLNVAKHDSALLLNRDAINLSIRDHDSLNISISHYNRGLIYLNLFQFDSAKFYVKKAQSIDSVIGSVTRKLNNLNLLALCALYTHDKDRFAENKKKIYTLIKEKKLLDLDPSTLLTMAKHAYSTTNFGLGNRYFDRYLSHIDSINSNAFLFQLNTLEKRLIEKERDDLSFKYLRNKKTLSYQRQLLIGGTISIILLFSLAFVIIRSQRQKQKVQQLILEEKDKNFALEKKQLEREQKISAIEAKLDTQETERQRISRELHDNVSPLLAVIAHNIDKSNISLSENVAFLSNSIRTISHQLVPIGFKESNLQEALINFLSSIDGVNGVQFNLKLPSSGLANLSKSVQTHVYRIIQELSNNILKHSQATEGSIDLIIEDKTLHLSVNDNGVGNVEKNEGFGIASIKERVSDLNGRLDISSKSLTGTTVKILIPLS